MILIAILGIAASVANKKKTAEAQRKRKGFPEPGKPASGPAPRSHPQSRSASTGPSTTARNTTLSKTPSAPGTSKWPWPEQTATQPEKKVGDVAYGGTPRYTHVVTSTLEGGHTHTESSMTGEEACPPPKPVKQPPKTEKTPAPAGDKVPLLNFQPDSVLRGVLYAEILGRPKALQRK